MMSHFVYCHLINPNKKKDLKSTVLLGLHFFSSLLYAIDIKFKLLLITHTTYKLSVIIK